MMTAPEHGWTALVLAGQRPSGDPLADHFGARFKAHVAVAGKPMLARVVAALANVPAIARIVVLGQDEAVMAVLDPGAARFVASSDGISASIAGIAGSEAAPWPVMVTTADHPLLTPDMVGHFLARAEAGDLAVGMVERRVLHAAYPDNRRTWFKLADGWWTGANLFALNSARVAPALALWSRIEQDRKKALGLVRSFGPGLFLRAATRTIGMRGGIALAGRRLGLDARLIDLPFAEAAIDVDKPADHALAEQILAARQPR